MATTKITDLTAYTDPVNTDVLPIVDVTSDVTKKVSIANVMKNASLGTAAAPGIAFDGDSNTGIYSPGADQVAISTGGSGRLRVSSTGTVEIVGAGAIGSTQAVSFNGSAPVNSMVLDSSGRLGIGTSTIRGTSLLDARGDISFGSNANYYGLLSYNAASGHIETISSDGGFKWIRASGSATSMTLDSSGRLLVGTSSARTNFENSTFSAAVQVEGTDYAGSRLALIRNGGGGGINLCATGGASVGSNTAVSSGAGLGEIVFAGSDGSEFVNAASITAVVDATPGANDMPGRLVFSTTADGASSPTERMRIGQNGKTTITAAAGVSNEALNWQNSTNTSGAYAAVGMLGSNCNNTSSYHYIAATGGTDKYYIYGNGTTGTPSDINLKKNIETTRDGYLEDLCQLRVVKYNWNEQADGDPKELGVIAQELEQVFPGLIQQGPEREDGSSYKAVKSSVLPFMLLKALQEAATKIETLEARLTALESA